MKKILPKEITSYDLLKALALLLMITDHVGHHFYHEEMWFRVLGRLCVPIWFFLIGYARTTDVPFRWLAAGGIVTLSAIISGQYIFPLDILFTMALIRYYRNGIAIRATEKPETLRAWFILLLLAYIPTNMVFEYGSMGMMFALFGFIMRNMAVIKHRLKRKHIIIYVFAVFTTFFLSQGFMLPEFTALHALVLSSGLLVVAALLWNFTPVTYPHLTEALPGPAVFIIQLLGRRTLEIYVLHILLFRAISMMLYPDTYIFMNWHLAPMEFLSFFGDVPAPVSGGIF